MNLIMSDKPLAISIEDKEATKYIDLSSLKIANCIGCFGCWTKTPGKCVIRDDAVQVYPYIAKSKRLLYVSRLFYGSYDTIMKTMLERALPIQQAFIRMHCGETHHYQRNVAKKQATILAYGDITDDEKDIFRSLVARNAYNMNFESYEIIFTTEEALNDRVNEFLKLWERF